MIARFKVIGKLDSAGPATTGTVLIDRASGLFTVKPYRRRREYCLPLSTVADIVVARLVKQEISERKAAKKRGRR